MAAEIALVQLGRNQNAGPRKVIKSQKIMKANSVLTATEFCLKTTQ